MDSYLSNMISTSRHGSMAEEFARRIRTASRETLRAIDIGETLARELAAAGNTKVAEEISAVVAALKSDSRQGVIGVRTGQAEFSRFTAALSDIAAGVPVSSVAAPPDVQPVVEPAVEPEVTHEHVTLPGDTPIDAPVGVIPGGERSR